MGRTLALLASAAAAASALSIPSAGDNLGLWTCGALPDRQTFDLEPATPPGPLASHIVVRGTTNPTLVFDISGPSNATGTAVHIWGSYDPVHPNQMWALQPSSTTTTGSLVSLWDGMCIGAQGPYIGAPVGIYPCNATDPTQAFTYDATAGTFALAAAPTLCIQGGDNSPSCAIPPFSTYPYCDPSQPLASRLDDLVGRMLPSEKAAALDSGVPAIARLGVPSMHSGEALHGAVAGCISSAANGSTGCPTSFPCPMALGATFDDALWADVGLAIGTEARALYNLGAGAAWVFAPNNNLCRAPSWGRCQEVPGEDATLVSRYASSFVRGLQGQVPGALDPAHFLAASTGKHTFAYDMEGFEPRTDVLPRPPTAVCDTPGGCQRWNLDLSPPADQFTSYYSAPFTAAFLEANISAFMCAYSGLYGKPACASPLINALYRSGEDANTTDLFVVSDCTAIELIMDAKWDSCPPPFPPLSCTPGYFPSHNYTHTVADTAIAALVGAGTDTNCGSFYNEWLHYLVYVNQSVPSAPVDLAVRRVYAKALRLGLLDPPDAATNPYALLGAESVDTPAHRALALRAAVESIVLLQNNATAAGGASPLLPLAKGLRLAFIGPHANSTQAFLSSYHGDNTLVDSHSPLMAAQALGLSVTYARGCNICDTVPPGFPNMPCTLANDTSGIAPAAAAAAAADVAILFIGSDQTTEAENFDRTDITLAGQQEVLAQAVLQAQPKTVVVIVSGSTVSSPFLAANAPAIVQAFYPGELGGDALISILTGASFPSGKLPMTVYPPSITERDIRDMDLASAGGITHSYYTGTPLYPFGWGLTYTTFSVGLAVVVPASGDGDRNGQSCSAAEAALPSSADSTSSSSVLSLPASSLRIGGQVADRAALVGGPFLRLAVTVRNEGEREGDAVLLAMARPSGSTFAAAAASRRPLETLLTFARSRTLAPGEARCVLLDVPAHSHAARAAFGEWVPDAARVAAAEAAGDREGALLAGEWRPVLGAEYELRVGDVASPARMRVRVE
jgi:xylan 1,4-beta-xylosidase